MEYQKKILLQIDETHSTSSMDEELPIESSTLNMYIASIEELKLGYSSELSENLVYEAFKSCVERYILELKIGTEAPLTLSRLEGAKNYLIRSLKYRKG